MAKQKADQDEAALSSMTLGRPEAILALKLTTALRVSRIHDLDNVSVAEAIAGLTIAINPFLKVRGKAAFFLGEGRVYLNGRAIRAGQATSWTDDLIEIFERLGIGGVIFSGAWTRPAVRGLLMAFKDGSRDGVSAIAEGTRAHVRAPARVDVLDPAQAAAFAHEEDEGHLASTERASFYYMRLVALAEALHAAVKAGRSPDVHARSVRQTFMKVVDFIGDPVFEQRLLAMTLLPPLKSDPLASHVTNVAVLSIPMGRLLALSRGRLADLGFAAFFHDLGWAGTGARSAEEDRKVAEGHIARGVARALRSRGQGDAARLRLLVAQEHHLRPDGYPELEGEPHPYSQIVGVADAFDQLSHGVKATGVGPAAALQALSDDDVLDPSVVALLWDVLGRYPRGSVLRLLDGSVVGVIDGGARRGDRPLARRVLSPGGTPDEDEALVEVDVDEVEEEVEPSTVGRIAAEIVFRSRGKADAGSAAFRTAWVPDSSGGETGSAKPASVYDPEQASAVKGLLEELQKAVRFYRLYPHDHPNCVASVDVVQECLSQVLRSATSVELGVRRNGLTLGDRIVLESVSHYTDLAVLLYPAGVRAVTFEAGVTAQELHEFISTLSGQEDDDVVGSDDLQTALWRHELPHIGHSVHDPLTPAAVSKRRDPLLTAVAERITEQMNRLVVRFDLAETELVRFSEQLEPVELDPGQWGALPERVQEFLESPEGEDRKQLVRAVHAFYREDLKRCVDVVVWSMTQKQRPQPADAGSFLAGAVLTALWREDFETAEALLAVAMRTHKVVIAEVSRCLTSRSSVQVLARLLRGTRAGDPQAELGLRYLQNLGDDAVESVCQAYPHMEIEVRKGAFWGYLAARAATLPGPIEELSQHDDENIAREAMLALAQGGEGSDALAFLMSQSEAGGDDARALAATNSIRKATGGGTRKEYLDTVTGEGSMPERIYAAKQLRAVGDSSSYDQLCTYVISRGFGQREEPEVEAVLLTLTALGGTRSVRVLEALRKGGNFSRQNAKKISRLADAAMDALRAAPKPGGKKKSGRFDNGVCPRCKFQNVPGVIRCLSCGHKGGASAKKKRP